MWILHPIWLFIWVRPVKLSFLSPPQHHMIKSARNLVQNDYLQFEILGTATAYGKICSTFGSECLDVNTTNTILDTWCSIWQNLLKFWFRMFRCEFYIQFELLATTYDKICSNFGSECLDVNTTYNLSYFLQCMTKFAWILFQNV